MQYDSGGTILVDENRSVRGHVAGTKFHHLKLSRRPARFCTCGTLQHAAGGCGGPHDQALSVPAWRLALSAPLNAPRAGLCRRALPSSISTPEKVGAVRCREIRSARLVDAAKTLPSQLSLTSPALRRCAIPLYDVDSSLVELL